MKKFIFTYLFVCLFNQISFAACRNYIQTSSWISGDGCKHWYVSHLSICSNGTFVEHNTGINCSNPKAKSIQKNNYLIEDYNTISMNQNNMHYSYSGNDPIELGIIKIYFDMYKNDIIGKVLTQSEIDKIENRAADKIQILLGRNNKLLKEKPYVTQESANKASNKQQLHKKLWFFKEFNG